MLAQEQLVKCISKGLTLYEIAAEVGTSYTTVRYWLRKHGLKTLHQQRKGAKYLAVHPCFQCHRTTKKTRLCSSCNAQIRRAYLFRLAIQVLGGRCTRCGWSGEVAGYILRMPGGDNLTSVHLTKKPWAVVKKSVAKCTLLCACCYRVMGDTRTDSFWDEVDRLKGPEW